MELDLIVINDIQKVGTDIIGLYARAISRALTIDPNADLEALVMAITDRLKDVITAACYGLEESKNG